MQARTSAWRSVRPNSRGVVRTDGGTAAGGVRAVVGSAPMAAAGDVDAAGKHEPQRLQHDGVGRALRDVAHRAHVERAEHVNVALGGRQHHDRNGRMRGAEVGEELEPVGAGQREVEEQQGRIGMLVDQPAAGLRQRR